MAKIEFILKFNSFAGDIINYENHFSHTISRHDKAGKDGISGKKILDNLDVFIPKVKRIFEEKTDHSFTPFLEILQSKGRGRPPRIISKPSLLDKVILGVIKDKLTQVLPLETPFSLPNERIRSVINSYRKVISRENTIVAKYDIKGFYDNIPHRKLLEKLRAANIDAHTIRLIESALHTPTIGWKERR